MQTAQGPVTYECVWSTHGVDHPAACNLFKTTTLL